MIQITKNHLKVGHRVRPGRKINVKYICIHSTGNPTSTALNERAWLDNPSNNRQASWNYCIDQVNCVEAIPPGEENWAQQGGNTSCISIEICESGDRAKTVERAAQFTAQLLKERGWGIDRLRRHYDFHKPKFCPAIFYQNKSWALWEDFKKKVQRYLDGAKGAEPFKPCKGKINVGSLNIRPEPGINKPPVGTLKEGVIVDLTGESGNFYQIKDGYIHKDYVIIVKEEDKDMSTNGSSIPDWKTVEMEYLQKEGVNFDYELWKTKIDDPMPAWAVFILMSRIHQNLKKK